MIKRSLDVIMKVKFPSWNDWIPYVDENGKRVIFSCRAEADMTAYKLKRQKKIWKHKHVFVDENDNVIVKDEGLR